jgi:flagellar biosynthesis/type III secretory pathway protein FliH
LEPPAAQPSEGQIQMRKALNVSEISDQKPHNGNGHIGASKQREESHQSAYEAGLAKGKEEGYRRGYREGFADCIKLDIHPRRAASAPAPASTSTLEATAANSSTRLKGLPCSICGCPSYSDEVQCPSCKTPKVSGRS